METPPQRRIEASTWVALACLAVGWFGLSLLVMSVGPVEESFHFYDMLAIVMDPTRLVTGSGGDSASTEIFLFGLLCAVIVCAPAAAHLLRWRVLGLTYLIPLALMLASGLALYEKTSGDAFQSSDPPSSFRGHLIHFANELTNRTGAAVAQHISIGAGAYLSLCACGWLAYKGWMLHRSMQTPTFP